MKSLLILAAMSLGQSPWYSDSAQAKMMKFWPNGVEFPAGAKFYEMSAAYQDWDGGLRGVHSPFYNISAVRSEPFGNANMEFPWGVTAGLHRSSGWNAYKFTNIADPKTGPITAWKEPQAYRWRYPVGTVFGEMLLVKNKYGYDNCFEVRMRTLVNTPDGQGRWEPEVFRPWGNADELPATAVKTTKRVKGHGVDAEVELWNVAALDPDQWLAKQFKTSRVAVTSDAEHSVVPKNYMGNIATCTACHSQTQLHARDIEPGRDWYGRVRGDHEIFSFHIFAESSISGNGFSIPVSINDSLNIKWEGNKESSQRHRPAEMMEVISPGYNAMDFGMSGRRGLFRKR